VASPIPSSRCWCCAGCRRQASTCRRPPRIRSVSSTLEVDQVAGRVEVWEAGGLIQVVLPAQAERSMAELSTTWGQARGELQALVQGRLQTAPQRHGEHQRYRHDQVGQRPYSREAMAAVVKGCRRCGRTKQVRRACVEHSSTGTREIAQPQHRCRWMLGPIHLRACASRLLWGWSDSPVKEAPVGLRAARRHRLGTVVQAAADAMRDCDCFAVH